ncbi:hypothetical protein [Acidithiobacillus sp.]|jgi:hypothetical protein|nr:hypothetical protein [Acidithiobacillus sp.]
MQSVTGKNADGAVRKPAQQALLDKQPVSELSVGAFCRKVSVSAASFYR